ncbi:uncharacterized protein SAMN05444411_1272 [Lutibacter oricola]|uniref:TPM domain-containing protein n=2 Tax=Lutibacter oricola TaxID=762486 RepID=A0A1H3H6D6_9FLAO|nr:uncharacterized protein SAMN05444411_1272 [Lutibacter oricola]
MRKIARLIIFGFLIFNVTNCKTVEKKKPNPNPPKVEFDSYYLGKSDFPEPKGFINDYELIFTPEEQVKLTNIIKEFEKKTSNQIAVVTIKSIGKYTDFDKYAVDLSDYWKIGQYNKDNGLTIILSKTLKKIRISTGNQTEHILTDEICMKILSDKIIPELKKGEYYNGIEIGLTELIKNWK